LRSSITRSTVTYLLVIPSLLFIFFFTAYPLGFMLYLSFFQWNGLSVNMKFIGLNNYTRLVSDGVFWLALRNNIAFSSLVVVGTVLIGLALALVIHRQIWGWRGLRNVYYLPVLLTSTVVGLLWTRFYDPYIGIFDVFLNDVGLSQFAIAWLGNPHTALLAVIVKEVWQYAGFPMILILAGLLSIDDAYLEVAQLDGASYFQMLRYVMLPLINNVLAITVALQIIFSFKVFDTIWAMTVGGPGYVTQVLTTYMYYVSFGFSGSPLEFGYAATIATVMVIIIVPIGILYLKLVKFGEMSF
jgi:raffinose/stachyose/melibiose transport system permease protein